MEEGPISNSEGKATLNHDGRATYVQHCLSSKSSSSCSVRVLSVAFFSLAVVYFLLRCFNLRKEENWLATSPRSLAVGGSRPCGEDGEDEEGEEAGENKGTEAVWVGEVEGGSGEQSAEGASGGFVRQTGEMQGLPSMAPGSAPWGLTAAPEGGHSPAAGRVREYAGPVQKQSYQDRRRLDQHHQRSGGTPWDLEGRVITGNGEDEQMGDVSRLLEGETFEMWEHRNLPDYAVQRLVHAFDRMMKAASVCRDLLGALTQRQQLRLAYETMRLLTLELGAISFVQEHLEPLRSRLGDAIAMLGNDALQRSTSFPDVVQGSDAQGTDAQLREGVYSMIVLVRAVQEPRPCVEENKPDRYRKKMITILQTATKVAGYCLGVLEGLSQFKDGERLHLSPPTIDNQIYIVYQLYRTHSYQITLDSSLRRFIVDCQKRTRVFSILTDEHRAIRLNKLPPLVEMVQEIKNAVERAGGPIPINATPPRWRNRPFTIQRSTPQQLRRRTEASSAAPRDAQPHEAPAHGSHHYPLPAEVKGVEASRLNAPSRLPHLPHPSSRVGYVAPQHYPVWLLQLPLPAPQRRQFAPREQEYSLPNTLPQAMAQYTALEESMHAALRVSEHGNVSATPIPYMTAQRIIPPQFNPQRSSPAFVGTSAHMGLPRYSSHGVHSTAAGPPLRPAVARSAEQASGGASGLDPERTQGGTLQRQEAEKDKKVGGLLGDLIDGGLKLKDIFPRGPPPDL